MTAVKWVTQSHSEFVVAHENGCLYFYNHTWREESCTHMRREELTDFPICTQREDCINPLQYWQVSAKAIYDMAFSPNGKYLAFVGCLGYLTVIQYHLKRYEGIISITALLFRSRKIGRMQSHFGAFQCLAWSPDSNYILVEYMAYIVPQCW
jgi:hypothetical protein